MMLELVMWREEVLNKVKALNEYLKMHMKCEN